MGRAVPFSSSGSRSPTTQRARNVRLSPFAEPRSLRSVMSGSPEDQQAVSERVRLQIEAYDTSALVYAAVKFGLPATMGSGRWRVAELADQLHLSPPHLHRFLRGLASLGVCDELPDGTYALTPVGLSLSAGSSS